MNYLAFVEDGFWLIMEHIAPIILGLIVVGFVFRYISKVFR